MMTIVRNNLKDIKASQADVERSAALSDDEIDFSDIPALTEEDFANARLVSPDARALRSLGVERAIIEKLGEEERPLREILNRVLRGYLIAQGRLEDGSRAGGVREEPDKYSSETE